MKGEGRPKLLTADSGILAAAMAMFGKLMGPTLEPFNRGPQPPEYRIHRGPIPTRSKHTHAGRRVRLGLARAQEQSDHEFLRSLGGRRSRRSSQGANLEECRAWMVEATPPGLKATPFYTRVLKL